jgi:tetratricopeptide (TPR) repeat protein
MYSAINRVFLEQACLSVFFVFCATTSLAQPSKIDSLNDAVLVSDSEERVNVFNALSREWMTTNKDSSLYYAKLAIKQSRIIGYKFGEGQAYYNISINDHYFGNYSNMLMNASEALALMEESASDNHQFELLSALEILGVSYWAQSQFDDAIAILKKAEQLCIKIENKKELAIIYASMSAIEVQRGQNRNSIEYSLKGLPLWTDEETRNGTAFSALILLFNSVGDFETSLKYGRQALHSLSEEELVSTPFFYFLGEAYVSAKKYDSARVCYEFLSANSQRLLRASQTQDTLRYYDWQVSRNAEIYLAEKNYSFAIKDLEKALASFEKVGDRNQSMWVMVRLMKAYRLQEKFNDAMVIARKLWGYANRHGARHHLRDANYMLYRLYDHRRQHDSAYKYLQHYNSINEAIDADQAEQRLAVFKSIIADQNNKVVFEQLNNVKRVQELELRQAVSQKYFLIISIVLLIGIGIILFRNISLKRGTEIGLLKIARNELLLEKLAAEATKNELERRASELEMKALRTQMNPHFIFNCLNSINRYILKNNKLEASAYLTKFSKLVRVILQNSQSQLIPLENELEALTLYIELEAARFEHQFSFDIKVSKDLDHSSLMVPPLFLQPYVENAIWHGLMHKEEHGKLSIKIYSDETQLLFVITDDGIGRQKSMALLSKSATKHKSFGMKITADRISMLNGISESAVVINDLVNEDGSSAGTEVVLKIPIKYD